MAEKMKFDFCGSVCYNKEYRAVAIFWYRKVLVLNFANPIRPGGGVRYRSFGSRGRFMPKKFLAYITGKQRV